MENPMKTEQPAVNYMKKIGLSIEAGTSQDTMDLTDGPFDFDFIYGAGAGGVTLFEKELFGKCSGDEIIVEVTPTLIDDVLGHLNQSIQRVVSIESPCFLKARVVSVEAPGQREIVQAIAGGIGSEGCGCGGGCGCGC